MNVRMKLLALPLIGASFLSFLSGCTVVGLMAGLSADHLNAHRNIHATWQSPDSIPKECVVEITLTDGSKLTGQYRGVGELSTQDYTAQYNHAIEQLQDCGKLPRLSDRLKVVRKQGPTVKGRFQGFGPGSVIVSPFLGPRADVRFTEIESFTNDQGESYDLKTIYDLMESRQLPIRTTVRLQTETVTVAIPLLEVQEFHAGPKNTHKWLNRMAKGFAMDAATVIAMCLFLSAHPVGY
jgi:hypothetical protein